MQICIDSNIVLKLVLPEDDSDKADALWKHWNRTNTQVVAPPSLFFESTLVLCTHVHRQRITADESSEMFLLLQALPILILYPDDLHRRAFDMSLHFGQPQAYDAHCLALAEMLGCEFWTADERLYNTVGRQLPWVRWFGNA